MRNFEYVMPKSIGEASTACAEKGAALKAAGVDLLDLMKGYVATPSKVVNLLAVSGLRDITSQKDGTHIGALVTLAQIADAKELPAVLVEAAAEAATPQVRNVGTVGGNLCQRPRCWYFRNDAIACFKKGGMVVRRATARIATTRSSTRRRARSFIRRISRPLSSRSEPA